MLRRLQRAMKNDFEEFNSRPYQAYTAAALARLAGGPQEDSWNQVD